ncbi:MAG: 3-oxoadipate CoA-transferase alpha subunit [Gammaproteobacteria bacterium]|jgi:3-oxoadipate CoA-transferase alpha subunit
MAIDKRIDVAIDAMREIGDGATVFVSGFGGAGFPNTLIAALREHGPKDLTVVSNSATHRFSLTHELIEAGMVRKVICSAARGHTKELTAFEKLYKEGRIELECVPQGTMSERIRAGGAGIAAFYTPVSVGTGLGEGKEVRTFNDREYVLETAISGELALIRGDVADRYGNLTFDHSQGNFGPPMATAASTTVAEVRVAQSEPIAPERVQLSGVFVDFVVAVGTNT